MQSKYKNGIQKVNRVKIAQHLHAKVLPAYYPITCLSSERLTLGPLEKGLEFMVTRSQHSALSATFAKFTLDITVPFLEYKNLAPHSGPCC